MEIYIFTSAELLLFGGVKSMVHCFGSQAQGPGFGPQNKFKNKTKCVNFLQKIPEISFL